MTYHILRIRRVNTEAYVQNRKIRFSGNFVRIMIKAAELHSPHRFAEDSKQRYTCLNYILWKLLLQCNAGFLLGAHLRLGRPFHCSCYGLVRINL